MNSSIENVQQIEFWSILREAWEESTLSFCVVNICGFFFNWKDWKAHEHWISIFYLFNGTKKKSDWEKTTEFIELKQQEYWNEKKNYVNFMWISFSDCSEK